MKIDTTTIPYVTITISIDEMFANTLNVYKNTAKELSSELFLEQIGEIHRGLYSYRESMIKNLFKRGYTATLINDGMDYFEKDCHRTIVVKHIGDGENTLAFVRHEDINF